jgi:hypothetical protein
VTAAARRPATPGRRYLLPAERQVIAVRRHPALLIRFLAESLGALLLAGWLTADLPSGNLVGTLLWLAALAVTARLGWKIAEWSTDRFVVTERRVLLVSGLLTRRVAMMPLRKVTDMTYERSVPGRLLGYGAFVMESAGQEQALHRVDYLPSPEALYLDVAELLFGKSASVAVLDDDDLAPVGRPTEVDIAPTAVAPSAEDAPTEPGIEASTGAQPAGQDEEDGRSGPS